MEQNTPRRETDENRFLTSKEIADLTDEALRIMLGFAVSLTATPSERHQNVVLLRMQQRLDFREMIGAFGVEHALHEPDTQQVAEHPKIHPSLLDDSGQINPAYYQYFVRR